MTGISIETIATVASFLFLSITQIILLLKGNTTEAEKIEIKKQKQINKLTNKKTRYLKKAIESEDKIKEIKGDEKTNSSI